MSGQRDPVIRTAAVFALQFVIGVMLGFLIAWVADSEGERRVHLLFALLAVLCIIIPLLFVAMHEAANACYLL